MALTAEGIDEAGEDIAQRQQKQDGLAKCK
jgi:hypothetical protein